MDTFLLRWAIFSFLLGVYCTGTTALVILGEASTFVLAIVAILLFIWIFSTIRFARKTTMETE